MNEVYQYQTNYFQQPWTWVTRVFEALIAVFFVFWIDLQEIEAGSQLLWIGYVFAGILAAYILLRPIDELALDKEKFYYLQRSIIPFFNRRRAYNISDIKHIKSSAAYTPILPVYSLLPGKLSRSRVEITTKDGRLERRHLTIDKRELDKIVAEVQAMVQ